MNQLKTLAFVLAFAFLGHAEDALTFEGTLCKGVTKAIDPANASSTFTLGDKAIYCVLRSSRIAPKGAALVGRILNEDGSVAAAGTPLVCNGASNKMALGFLVAGTKWARVGTFTFRVSLDGQAVLEVPFEVEGKGRYALLVAIEKYAKAPLPGCKLDCTRMRRTLTSRFGFADGNVVTLLDEKATRDGIIQAMLRFAQIAEEDDVFVFYFSGHGTQVPDINGDEEDGWDEAIVPYDRMPDFVSTEKQLGLFLIDDHIQQLLQKFKTRNITVIFDSCHSGSAVRAGAEELELPAEFGATRRRDYDFSRKLVKKARAANRSGAKVKGVSGIDIEKKYVFISACRSWETSLGGPQIGGVFSHFFNTVLTTTSDQSWDEIVSATRNRVHRHNPGQSPTVTGGTRRFPFLLTEAAADAPFVRPTVAVFGAVTPQAPNAKSLPVRTASGGTGNLALLSGVSSLTNEQAGAIYDVYAASDAEFKTPKGRVVQTGGVAQSVVMYQGRPVQPQARPSAQIVKGSVERGDRLLPRTVRIPGTNPRVGLFVGKTTAGTQRVGRLFLKRIKNEQGLSYVKGAEPHQVDYAVLVTEVNGKPVVAILTPARRLLAQFDGNDKELYLKTRNMMLLRHRQFARVNRLSNPSPAFRLDASIEGGENIRKSGGMVEIHVTPGQDAVVFAFAAHEGNGLWYVAGSGKTVKAGERYTFVVNIPEGTAGQMAFKCFASQKTVNLAGMPEVPMANRATELFNRMRKVHPGTSNDFLGTDGWADKTIWIQFTK